MNVDTCGLCGHPLEGHDGWAHVGSTTLTPHQAAANVRILAMSPLELESMSIDDMRRHGINYVYRPYVPFAALGVLVVDDEHRVPIAFPLA